MITDKDKEEAKTFCEKIKVVLSVSVNGVRRPDEIKQIFNTPENIENFASFISRIRTESADQARKEAADRAVEFIRDQGMEQMEMWGEYDDNRLRAAILNSPVKEGKTSPDAFDMALRVLAFNPSVPNATGKLADMIEQYAEDYCAEKLAIAVKALEKISGRGMTGGGIAKRALKEIE